MAPPPKRTASFSKMRMPGVVSVPQGAWYQPEGPGGLDVGGSVNVLTSHQQTAYAKANGQHSALVEIRKA